jgi:hypothetical protein
MRLDGPGPEASGPAASRARPANMDVPADPLLSCAALADAHPCPQPDEQSWQDTEAWMQAAVRAAVSLGARCAASANTYRMLRSCIAPLPCAYNPPFP